MQILTYEEYKQKRCFSNLGMLLLMPVVIDFFSVIIRQSGISSSSMVTLLVYGIVLVVVFIRTLRITSFNEVVKDLLLCGIMLVPFLVNFLFFEETRRYMVSPEMLLVYFFYIPIAVCSLRKITKWDEFFDALLKPGMMAIGLGIIILFCMDYQKYLVYMGFSYALLPFICVFYRVARLKNNIVYYGFFFAGMVSILIFGSRAAIGWAVIYVIIFEIFRADRSCGFKVISFSALGIMAVMLLVNINVIITTAMKINAFKGSYFLKNLAEGRLLKSGSRNELYTACMNRLSTMGVSVSGFFGDRDYCVGFAYPHNIFLEVLMSLGWILGLIAIIVYIICMIRAVLDKDPAKCEVAVFVVITMLARYVISGSYLTEGKFWIATVLLISLISKKKEFAGRLKRQ